MPNASIQYMTLPAARRHGSGSVATQSAVTRHAPQTNAPALRAPALHCAWRALVWLVLRGFARRVASNESAPAVGQAHVNVGLQVNTASVPTR